MLYEDKYGVFWIEEEVNKLSIKKKEELKLTPVDD